MQFLLSNLVLGVALAMDAFSVSVANGLSMPNMKHKRKFLIAFAYGFSQAVMPFIGWLLVVFAAKTFKHFEPLIPWIALILLGFIGGKMILENLKKDKEESKLKEDNFGITTLLIQSIATSIDALSVGFTISEYDIVHASVASAIIGIVTFILCVFGVEAGRKIGSKISGFATVIGGIILILIGIKIFVSSLI